MSNKPRRRTLAHFAANADGLAAIETALIAPILFLLLVGVIQFGWAVHCAASVRWALDASGRQLMINPSLTADDLHTTMVDKLKGLADAKDLTLTITPDETDGTLVVESTYKTSFVIPITSNATWTFKNRISVPNLATES